MNHVNIIAQELNVADRFVTAVINLLDEGGTVPFISRYRKEQTNSMDEVGVAHVRDRIQQLRELDKRREAILKSISEQEKLTPELEKKILAATNMAELEDLYLPYKPKRKTKASIAKEKGLEPLADQIQQQQNGDVYLWAEGFVNNELGVMNADEALQGARDILAERVNEHADVRRKIREFFAEKGIISSKVIKGKEAEAEKFKDYFEWSEPIKTIPSHRLLAIRRGEKEMFLSMDIEVEEEIAVMIIEKQFDIQYNAAGEQMKLAIRDGYKRLLKPSIETEIRLLTKTKADEEAIRVFAENLKQLLMAAPLGQKNVLALDPGFRTGCKLVCLDKQGKLLHNEAIYPNEPQRETTRAAASILNLVSKYQIEAIVIGNGTASRETEQFVKSIGLPASILVAMVNESGASIYSASEVAREEFPEHDVTVRGAVSIGRRIMDPLAELVKIDPKSIGVGQYQHDVDQNQLKSMLDDVVVGCVNNVGVELNTASKQLLTYVSGLGPQLADNIVKYRNENGPFKSRNELKKVPRLGDKAFEQAAGFLRIRGGANLLDSSAVHPERYELVQKIAADQNCSVADLMHNPQVRKAIRLDKYVSGDVGLPTLQDIMQELEKPGRDPREQFEVFAFDDKVHSINDLKVGMKLPGIVTNITKFGAFVDIGVHQDGLVHISHLSDKFIQDPSEAVKLQQKVQVTVVEVEPNRKRISLSMKSDPFGKQPTNAKPRERTEPRSHEQKPLDEWQQKLAGLKGKFS